MLLKTFKGGLHIKDYKWLTDDKSIKTLSLPPKVYIPVHQHFGLPSEPIVKIGDFVKTGALIAKEQGKISSNIHASISGKIISIDKYPHPLGIESIAIGIESDGKDEKASAFIESDPVKCIESAGVVGMGGAMFPTHVKLQPPPDAKIDSIIVNAAECEPYVTCDYRLMIEEPERILKGLKIIMDIFSVNDAYIGIEANKPRAIKILRKKINEKFSKGIKVIPLKAKYPQGGEKQLIKAILKREIPSSGLPFNVGAVVQNVATIVAVYEAIALHKPLYERIVTVVGSCVKDPGNYRVRIGTLFSDIVELTENPGKLVMGGPMMGFAQYTFSVPVIKGTNAILVMNQKEIKEKIPQPCIKCGKCVVNCPMGLWPGRLADLIEKGLYAEAKELGLKDCIECGICAFSCPSLRNVVQLIKHAKQL